MIFELIEYSNADFLNCAWFRFCFLEEREAWDEVELEHEMEEASADFEI